MRVWPLLFLLLIPATKIKLVEPWADPDFHATKQTVKQGEILENIGSKFTQYTIADYINQTKIARPLRFTVVHNSASPARVDTGLQTVIMFRDWHVNHRHWSTIGYHWVISTDGTIYAARKMGLMGAHAGPGNEYSIGVCLVGNLEDFDQPTEAQKEAFAALHLALRNKYYGFNQHTVHFHREFMQTACPGKISIEQVETWVKRYEQKQPTSQRPQITFNNKPIGQGYLFNDEACIKIRDLENAGFIVDWSKNKIRITTPRISKGSPN